MKEGVGQRANCFGGTEGGVRMVGRAGGEVLTELTEHGC